MIAAWTGLVAALLCQRVSAAETTYHALIAGYGPWGSTLHNPSAMVAEALNNTCYALTDLVPRTSMEGSLCFEGWNITVDHAGASQVAESLATRQFKDSLPDVIVHLGLESFAKGLKVEVAAVNKLAESKNQKIEDGGPEIATPTFDLGGMALADSLAPLLAVSNTSVDEMWSRDAGAFYCNEALYRTSRAVRKLRVRSPRANRLLPVAFVHLPTLSNAPLDVVKAAVASFAATLFVDDGDTLV